jgi:hypothetical protein
VSERELTEPVALCTSDGRLNPDAVGWSRRPLHDCTLASSWGRRKRWDYWCVTAPGCAFSLVYADVDYVGIAGVWFCDFASGHSVERGSISPFASRMLLPPHVGVAPLELKTRKLAMTITEEAGGTRLRAAFDGFHADVLARRPDGHESLGVVIPWSTKRFQYTNKDVARPAEGTVSWRDKTYTLAANAWACLDYGRGKWPYRTKWNWGAGAGQSDGRTVGIQVGGKWTDGTGMTENAISVDGRLSKISEDLEWVYDTSNWLRPWTIRTPSSDRVDLTFSPIYDKTTRLHLGAGSQDVDQCFGFYTGTVTTDDGERVAVDGLFGWAEEATWRW